MWIQWLAATAVAAITGVFGMMAYNNSTFLSRSEFSQHQKTVHIGAVNENRYEQDIEDVRRRVSENGRKLDAILSLMVTQKGK